MNKFLKIAGIVLASLGVLAVLIMGIFSLAWNMTAGVADSTDKFFTLIKDNKAQEAYNSTAKAFQTATTFDEFANFLKNTDLDKYVSANWSTRAIENEQGHLEGSVVTSNQGTIPMEVNLVKEGDTWKILNMRPVTGGLKPIDTGINDLDF